MYRLVREKSGASYAGIDAGDFRHRKSRSDARDERGETTRGGAGECEGSVKQRGHARGVEQNGKLCAQHGPNERAGKDGEESRTEPREYLGYALYGRDVIEPRVPGRAEAKLTRAGPLTVAIV